MVVFLVVLIILGAALEIFSLHDSLSHVEFEYKPSVDRVEPDQPFDILTTVTNTGRLPITYVRAEVSYPIDAMLPEGLESQEERFSKSVGSTYRLWGHQRVRRSMPTSLHKRGMHIFEGATLRRGDFLGLKETERTFDDRHEVLVYPKPLDSSQLHDALGSYCGDMIARRHLIRDPIITMGVREYTGREPMKTISWTQSARRGELMVREFDFTRDLSCTVLLATNGIGPMDSVTLDKCCSAARTVCESLTERGVNIDLYTNAPLWGFSGRRVWSCNAGPGHHGDMLETLARVYAASRCPAQELASIAVRAAGSGAAFVLIAPYDNDQMQAALKLLHDESGVDPLFIAASEL